MHIRYKPRINLGIVSNGRKSIDYTTRYYANGARLSPTTAYAPPSTTLLQPIQPPPIISVPISPPASFYEPAPGILDVPAAQWQTAFPSADATMPLDTAFIPEQFVYSKEQIMDMLARGASETFERSGETDSGLPIDTELEQKSRELDATKNYVINASGEIIPLEPKAAGGGLALLAAAVAAFFLFGG